MSALRHSLALSLLLASSGAAVTQAAADTNVVVSIKPIHSLVASVMKGAGEPTLLIEGAQSPHSFSLRPSQARTLQEADAVFWVGDGIESFMPKALEAIATKAVSIELMDTKGLSDVEGDDHDHHDHGGHGDHADHDDHKDEHAEHKHDEHDHDDHKDEHAEDKHGDHDHDDHKDEHAEHDHDEDKHEDHAGHDDHDGHSDEAGRDPHIWLDPQNASVIVGEIAERLAALDPDHADLYRKNAASTQESLAALTKEVAASLASVKDTKFMAFHDAYGHFENRFGVESAGALTINPEVAPGAKRLRELQAKVKSENIKCVFAEPQFDASGWKTVLDNTDLKLGVIDPLGFEVPAGPDMYAQLIRNVADSLTSCAAQ